MTGEDGVDQPIEYGWQRMDYYEILNLPSKLQHSQSASRKARRKYRDQIDLSQIKKSYRTQAQLYHPDKATTTAKNATKLSKQESTARFARIAEAYEVLKDDNKRKEYDEWLLDCEDYVSSFSDWDQRDYEQNQQQQQPPQQQHWLHKFRSAVDPRRVFEDFFFGYAETTFDGYQNRRKQQIKPIRVYETREMMYTSTSQHPILRVYQTEEYAPNIMGNSKYRIIAQDFMEQYDPYSGYWTYQPISQPTLLEEGFRRPDDMETRNDYDSTLYASEFMTPNHQPLRNGRYTAGLTPECELVILEQNQNDDDDDDNEEDHVVWSSDTYVPPSHLYRAPGGGCFMSMQGPVLVVALGSPEQQGPILWNSQVIDDDVWLEDERIRMMGGLDPQYFVRLEEDGNLVVYSERIVSYGRERPDYDARFANDGHNSGYNTKAARAWRSVRRWFRKRLSPIQDQGDDEHYYKNAHDHPSYSTRTYCLYATGPAGCNASGRKLLHIAHKVGRGIQRKVQQLDHFVDEFMDILRQDDDEDLGDIFIRIVNHAGKEVKSGAQRSATAIRDFFQEQQRERMKKNHRNNKRNKKKRKN